MCGISGIWNLNASPLQQEELRAFNNSLRHRGPDDEGYYFDTASAVGLGHRRLSIIDLSEGGHQPMLSGDSRYAVVYNGEVYNFIELREELKALGHSFRSDSDTEVLLASYIQWGEKCLLKFNGMWAFAIWDSQDRTLFLARDRFGIKPLYFQHRPGVRFCFASETLSFRFLSGPSRQLDSNALTACLSNVFSLEGFGRTIFQGIEQIRPGHFARVTSSGVQQKRYWKTADHRPEVPERYEEQVEKFGEILTDACRLRLRSDVPVGTALSGGLDSSSVYCILRRYSDQWRSDPRASRDWQRAFVREFPGAANDEGEYARQVIEAAGGKAVFIRDEEVTADKILRETLEQDYVYLTPPVAEPIYGAMRANGVFVSMDGHGVDEMLGGYPHLVALALADALNRKDQNRAADLTRVYEEMTGEPLVLPARSKLRSAFSRLPKGLQRLVRRMRAPAADPWLRQRAPRAEPDLSFADALNANFHETLLPTILRNFDRASMRNGVEIRMPFMDYRLVSFVFGLPDESRVGAGFTKRILRDAMKGILPESVRQRKLKIGLNAPMPELFAGELRAFVSDTVASRRFLESAVWDGPAIQRFVEQKRLSWTLDECVRVWPYLAADILAGTA